MGSIIFRRKITQKKALIRRHPYPSSLLIPSILWESIPENSRKKLPHYIAQLCSHYWLFLQSTQYLGQNPLRITFQEKGQSLKRVSYRPEEECYQELKSLSLLHGVSITFLVSLMVRWENLGLWSRTLRHFWKGRKLPFLCRINVARQIDKQGKRIVLSSRTNPSQFVLNKGSPRWVGA